MTVRLTVQRQPWLAHVHATAAAYGDGLVPVVKGNGYGVGRPTLHEVIASLPAPDATRSIVAIGSVHELYDVPPSVLPVVLTPTLAAPLDTAPILTVGSLEHVAALRGWSGRVMVKLASSMRRYGVAPADLPALLHAVDAAGLAVAGYALHLPLAGTDARRVKEIRAWAPHLTKQHNTAQAPLWVSHLAPARFRAVRDEHPALDVHIRVGTALWHGVPRCEFLHLTADVLHTQRVHAGDVAGYHASVVPFDGTLVVVGAGTCTGVAPLDGNDPQRQSPFHFARTRLEMLERPHMHTTMLVVPDGHPCPAPGDRVDVQRPLISTTVDEVEWQ